MSTQTTNYGLIKPQLTDTPDITTLNENWDIIDEKLKEMAESNDLELITVDDIDRICGVTA